MPKQKRKPVQVELREDVLVPAIQRVAIKMATALVRPPLAERAEWDDPADINTRSKAPRQVLGYRRTDPLRTLHIKQDLITKEHLAAAERLRDDCELGHGARPGSERSEIRSSGHSGGPGDAQLDALRRYTAALSSVGYGTKSCELMLSVVIHGSDVTAWCEGYGISRHVGVGLLVAALDLLKLHYDGPAVRRR